MLNKGQGGLIFLPRNFATLKHKLFVPTTKNAKQEKLCLVFYFAPRLSLVPPLPKNYKKILLKSHNSVPSFYKSLQLYDPGYHMAILLKLTKISPIVVSSSPVKPRGRDPKNSGKGIYFSKSGQLRPGQMKVSFLSDQPNLSRQKYQLWPQQVSPGVKSLTWC